MLPSKTSAYLKLHLIVFIWGFTALLGALISIEAIPLVWHRMGIATAIVLVYLLIKNKSDLKFDKSAMWMLLAGVLIAIHWITFFHAIKISTVSVTLACMSTGAFFGSLLEPLFYKRKIDLREISLGLLVIAGLYIIFSFESQYTWGIVTALCSAFLSALFSVVNAKLVKKHSPVRITFMELLGGWLAIGIFAALQLGFGTMELTQFTFTTTDALYLFILGGICTAYPFIESVAIMRQLSPFSVLLTINLEPVYGIALAFFILGDKEHMSPHFYLGASIILLTVVADGILKKWISTRKRNTNASEIA